MPIYIKDPDAFLDYGFDWSEWLESGEIIATSTWIAPDGITKGADTYSDDATSVWMSGGAVGCDYVVVNRVTTNQSRQDDRSITIKVRNR